MQQTIDAWRIIFYVTVVLYIIEIIMYTTFGSGEEQAWNKIVSDSQEQQPLQTNPNGYNSTEKGEKKVEQDR